MVAGGRELIDTLWNVNAFLHHYKSNAPSRINRYIMECKFICIYNNIIFCFELIDTLWNVNYFSAYFLFLLRVELIDTLWNVNPYFLRNKELVNEN